MKLLIALLSCWVLLGCGRSSVALSDEADAVGTGERKLSPRVDASHFLDKVTAGYQGWFGCPEDFGGGGGWTHWSPEAPRPGRVTFELYPDVREYDPRDLYQTQLGPLGNGRPAQLFSSASDRVIDVHFRWMEEYGIDGVGLQRFVVGLDGDNPRGNQITRWVREAAERHGRIFYVMYDNSGARPGDWDEVIKRDWQEVMEGQLQVTSSPQYAHQDGKPVVNLWGLGFDDRPGTAAQSVALVNWFKARGVYVAGGVPYWWRSPGGGKAGFEGVYAALNLVQPWAVGTFGNQSDVDAHFNDLVAADKALTQSRGQAYQRVLWAGFAWSNWNGGARNAIPRQAGRFFWRQAYQAKKHGVSAYIAMFDEYDEGTAIAKAAEDSSMIPSDQYFLTLDADGTRVSSDFYLRLAGAATQMLRGQRPLSATVPVPAFEQTPPPPPAPPAGNVLPAASARRLLPDQTLQSGDRLYSPDARSFLTYQGDGNLVLYTAGNPAWASNTQSEPGRTVMQSDGNLVIYDGSGRPVWASNSHGNPGAFLSLLDDGRFGLYRPDGQGFWSSAAH